MYIKHVIFQSTRPSRASTLPSQMSAGPLIKFQSTRPSRASTQVEAWMNTIPQNFNPQGPRGPRHWEGCCIIWRARFQSTRPSRASTIDRQGAIAILQISIHKALAGLDPRIQLDKFIKINFNPQGPRGPRQ